MLSILSKEEFEKQEKEMNGWLLALDWNTKAAIFSLLKPLQKQAECEHFFQDTDNWKNDFPKNTLICFKCNYSKLKNAAIA